MEKVPLREMLSEAERLIVRGQIKAAAQLIDKSNATPNTRLETFELARIYRRIGNPEHSLRLLAPTVRPKAQILKPATDEERLEYAIALQRVGSLLEASGIIEKINSESVPDVLLVQAVVLFSQWNYKEAIPLLEKFLRQVPADSFNARLGKVNLCAALVHEGRPESKDLLEELIRETQQNEEYLLMGNAYEISAQSAVRQGQYDEADQLLKKAEDVLSGVKILDFLWLIKWKNILSALREKSLVPLEVVKEEALRKKHWETLREVDFYRLQVEYSDDVFLRLYYGTKSTHYRERVRKMFPQALVYPAVSLGEDGGVGPAGEKDLDIFSLSEELAPGTTAHALLVHFLSDSYRGFRTGELHSILFPGDYYNPDTSLNRVHQTVSRFRKTLAQHIPFAEIEIDDYIYRLKLKGPKRLKLPAVLPESDPLAIKLFVFDQRYPDGIFASDDVQSFLQISKANANKLLNQWLEAGLIHIHLEQRPRLYKKL